MSASASPSRAGEPPARPARAEPAVPLRGGLAGWQVRRVEAFVSARLPEATVTRLAAECRLSPLHFARAFRTSFALPPSQWLIRQRIDRARRLLEVSDAPVGQIATAVGYAGAAQLTRVFRRALGACPRDYRRR